MDYHILREIADSWVLLLMFVFFVGAVVWAFRPGSRRGYSDAGDDPVPPRRADLAAEGEPRT